MTSRERLDFHTLHHRHYGVTPEIAGAYAQAASVCLNRHHSPPVDLTVSADDRPDGVYLVEWTPPTDRQSAAWDNRDDATRDGAYGVVLASAEKHLGLVAVRRAKTLTGSDYFLGAVRDRGDTDDELDLEGSYRLEVSGIDRCDGEPRLRYRVRQKVDQARAGQSNLPAIAGVVAFNLLRVILRTV